MCRACILLVCNGYPKWSLRSCLEWETTPPGSQTISPDVAIESPHDEEPGRHRSRCQPLSLARPGSLSPSQFCLGCTTITFGYDFRKAQAIYRLQCLL